MLTSNAFLATSTSTRRRSGTRAPFAARRARSTYRTDEAFRLAPTTTPTSLPLAA